MRRTYDPQPISYIAERALVDRAVARSHLQRLADHGFVVEENGEYRRASESVVREGAGQILDDVDIKTVEQRVGESRESVCEYRTEEDLADED